jgi:hypothetical protein
MFLAGLEVSCLEFHNSKFKLHIGYLVTESAVDNSADFDTIIDCFNSIIQIIKDCKDPGFIDDYLTEIRKAWTDEASRAELLKQYNIPPRKQIIQEN